MRTRRATTFILIGTFAFLFGVLALAQLAGCTANTRGDADVILNAQQVVDAWTMRVDAIQAAVWAVQDDLTQPGITLKAREKLVKRFDTLQEGLTEARLYLHLAQMALAVLGPPPTTQPTDKVTAAMRAVASP